MFQKMWVGFLFAWMVTLQLIAAGDLNTDQRKILEDTGGWEYVKLSDSQRGVQTEHTCFNGQPHPDECSGELLLKPSNEFIASVTINGQTVSRHGTYTLSGDQITFFDEFGTKDGPYALSIDFQAKSMVMQMDVANGGARSELMLRRKYKEELKKRSNAAPQ